MTGVNAHLLEISLLWRADFSTGNNCNNEHAQILSSWSSFVYEITFIISSYSIKAIEDMNSRQI